MNVCFQTVCNLCLFLRHHITSIVNHSSGNLSDEGWMILDEVLIPFRGDKGGHVPGDHLQGHPPQLVSSVHVTENKILDGIADLES